MKYLSHIGALLLPHWISNYSSFLNIVFQHPVALLYHLYTFTVALNATIFTITLLHKIKN
jgi:hypothetical protein